jgi:hypothetical protein
MSCDACNTAQELRGPELGKHVYVRVGNGNVELVGCETHVKDVIAYVRMGQGIIREDALRYTQNTSGTHDSGASC